jgi:hypothetical protein
VIADEVYDRMRECWQKSVPEPYRNTGHGRGSDALLPAPPGNLGHLFNFIFSRQHVTPRTEEALRKRWAEMISERFRYDGHERVNAARECNRHVACAIIA